MLQIKIKNSQVNFLDNKNILAIESGDAYVNEVGTIIPGATFKYYKYDVSKLKKVKVKTLMSESSPRTLCVVVFQKNGGSVNYKRTTTNGYYEQTLDVCDADVMYVNTTDHDNTPVFQVEEYRYTTDNEISGTKTTGVILKAAGETASNQYFNVTKFDVSGCKVVQIFTTLNGTTEFIYAIKKDNITLGNVPKFQYGTYEREGYNIDVVDADEIWVSCLNEGTGASCFKLY